MAVESSPQRGVVVRAKVAPEPDDGCHTLSTLRPVGRLIERFALFPLGLVLLPGEAVPLHIFEERYKTMFAEVEEFGIVWLSDSELQEVGCTARVVEVLERMDDGRLNVVVQGVAPFRVLQRVDDMPYPAADVEILDDEEGTAGEDDGSLARERYADLVERATDQRPPVADLAEIDAYGMAASLDFALDAKQELLELRSEGGRLERLAELFGAAIRRLDDAERVAERASRNGSLGSSG